MEEDRKNAYRYLLYRGMLDIRPIAWLRVAWWNPLSLFRELRRARLAGDVADALHNLGFYASCNFVHFDEERFWRDLEAVESRFPEFDPTYYRNMFQGRLDDLNGDSSE